MKNQNNISLLNSLEQLSTSDLDAMLHSELESELPDEQAIQLILQVLRKREKDFPLVNNPPIDKAWDTYQKKTSQNPFIFKEPLIKVAVALVLCSLLLFALPQEVQAENFLNRIATWTGNMFELFNQWSQMHSQKEYVFQTDHSGLQKLYDSVTELGVTFPVVPMWLSNEYELVVLDVSTSPVVSKILAGFVNSGKEAVFEINIYSDNIQREFHKNEANVEIHESNGVIHYIFRNNDLWTVVWAKDNVECSIAIDSSESDLYRIVDSIYASEE